MDAVRGGRLREKAIKSGLYTEDDLDQMSMAWEMWMKKDDASVAMLHGEILIQK